MELTLSQQDALTELINIGYGRAAGALSELTGYRITLEVPRITMQGIDEIPALLGDVIKGEMASVSQSFSGAISGHALLLMDEKSARAVSGLLSDTDSLLGSFDTSRQEIITEVGNIVLNACLGVFGNVLEVQIAFAVPRFRIGGGNGVLQSIMQPTEELKYSLMIHTHFHLRNSSVTGYLIIILGIASLDRMLLELGAWEARQTS
jgi:chemotaxis protein CheC